MDKKVIDIIIPFADSFKELDLTIKSLINQSDYVNNILVVASGKFKLILFEKIKLFKKKYNKNFNIEILLDYETKTTPGTARNRGIDASNAIYLGFIDSGMTAHKLWLPSFISNSRDFIRLGSTRFKPKRGLDTISALLAYGSKDAPNTVPGTIIESRRCIRFPIDPNYGEDIIWLDQYKSSFNKNSVYPAKYTFFCKHPISTLKKFYNQINEVFKYKSSYRSKNYTYNFFLVVIYSTLSIIFFLNINLSVILIISYLFIRFFQKNKFMDIFKIEGIITLPLLIITDIIKIYLTMKNLLNYENN